MKKMKTIAVWLSPTLSLILLVTCSMLVSSCEDPEVCINCNVAFSAQKKVRQINHVVEGTTVEKYKYFYDDQLIDSIYYVKRNSPTDSTYSKLKVTYPHRVCLPSGYLIKKYTPGNPVSLEKGMMTLADNIISNKHIASYDDADYLAISKNAEIDYVYDGSGKVIARNGTDYGLMTMFPSPYGNLNSYTYTGSNISSLSATKEQSGYTLNFTYDTRNNPFNIQSGALYYLNLISYPDLEYFETLCLDQNNPTQIVYQGTDTSNSHVTITYTITYTYTPDNYPLTVAISESYFNGISNTTTVTNLGRFDFTYY